MPGRMETTDSNAVDIGKRYDIYVAETLTRIVVYRGAFFRGVKELEKTNRLDISAEFMEIEQATGETVFLRRHSIIKFCEAGSKLTGELVAGEPPAE